MDINYNIPEFSWEFCKWCEQEVLPRAALLDTQRVSKIKEKIRFLKSWKDVYGLLLELENIDNIKIDINKWFEVHISKLEKSQYLFEGFSKMSNMFETAKEFIKDHPIFYDKAKIWWVWSHKTLCWEMVDETDILNAIDNVTKNPNVDSSIKNEILEALKRIGRKTLPEDVPKTWVQFHNKIIDVQTKEEIIPSPQYLIVNPIPWKIGGSKETPEIDKIITEWVGEEYKETLYEIMAYCLLPDYPLHRIFCLVGSGLNGKGTFLRLLERFLGVDNITSCELDDLLDSRFATAKLFKKLVCMMGETNFNKLERTSLLKRLTGQDAISFEFKNKNPFDSHNYAKIIIATNTLPITLDKTIGFYRRWLIIEFPKQFTEKEDVLSKIPDIEFNNLCLKLTDKLHNLLKKREFINEGDIKERMKRYEEKSNPIGIFIKNECIVNQNEELPFFEFYEAFQEWCNGRGYRVLSKIETSKVLREDGFEIQNKNVKKGDGNNDYTTWKFITGLNFNQKTEKMEEIKE